MADFVKKPPSLFRYKIEPITFIMQNEVPYAGSQCYKVFNERWRYKHDTKDKQLQDLHKAKQYIDLLIEKETQEGDKQLSFRFGDTNE